MCGPRFFLYLPLVRRLFAPRAGEAVGRLIQIDSPESGAQRGFPGRAAIGLNEPGDSALFAGHIVVSRSDGFSRLFSSLARRPLCPAHDGATLRN